MFENMSRNLTSTIQRDSKIKCYLEEHVWNKMMGWCKAANSEVSGMGLCKIVRGHFVVYDVFFPLQYGSSGYTELDDRALAKLQIGLYNKKIPANHFRFWWHTHYNFNVFWSGTDDNNATTLAQANGEWELSLVINQKSEFRCRADFFKKIHPLIDEPVHVLVDNLDVELIPNSRRHRAKPHYKADVKRWVKPMDQLPEKQKPKINACEQVYTFPGTKHERFNGKTGQWETEHLDGSMDWWEKRWSDSWNDDAWCPKCDTKGCDRRSICDTKPKHEEKKPESKKHHELENGDKYGDFIFYNGFLLSSKDYEAAIKTDVDEPVDVAEAKLNSDGDCLCGDPECKNYDLCVHCTLCEGRCQAATGYCPGCFEAYYGIDPKEGKSAKLKSKAVN